MSIPTRLSSRAWVAVPLCALVFLIVTDALRIRRVEFVSAIGENAGTTPRGTAPKPAWRPRLIVPEHDNVSYEWLDQTRLMFARREWRVRHVEYENAPVGRDVYAPSPYRWWLGLLAGLDHLVTGRPAGPALEHAALLADPLLHALLLVGAVAFAAWQFGRWAAALLAAGLAAVFPFAAGYLPGAPNDQGLVQACVLWSVLPLLAGIRAAQGPAADAAVRARRWFIAAGLVGGLGLWIGVAGQVPILFGIGLGGLAAAWVARTDPAAAAAPARAALPWLAWSLAGAATCLAAYLLEYFPGHLGAWQLRVNHPLYGLAWLGGGALLTLAAAGIQRTGARGIRRTLALAAPAVLAVAALPVAMWRAHNLGFLDAELPAFRLTRLPGDVSATNLGAWIIANGFTPQVWATVLPVLLVVPAGVMLWRRRAPPASRAALAVALGPVLVGLGFACWQLRWWNEVDLALLALLVAAAAAVDASARGRVLRWLGSAAAAIILLLGGIEVFPRTGAAGKNQLLESEVLGLIERDLARWIAAHAGPDGGVVLTPHNLTVSLYYYGGLTGLATLNRDNVDGLGVAVRILSASTPEEAKELIDQRGVTCIVLPSWDTYLEVYARMGMGKIEGTFYELLTYWKLPPWLEPVPYQLPTVAGFEGQSVTVLKVVEPQDDASALSRLAEYLAEMKQLDSAAAMSESLRRFPADAGALAARAQVTLARGETAGLDRTVESLQRRLAGGADRALPWDRRVSIAIVLALTKHPDLAREQVQRCLADVNEARLRSLTTVSLFRLLALGRNYGLPIADPRLRQLALDLLPPDLSGRLQQ